jgi:hypothetical protein
METFKDHFDLLRIDVRMREKLDCHRACAA